MKQRLIVIVAWCALAAGAFWTDSVGADECRPRDPHSPPRMEANENGASDADEVSKECADLLERLEEKGGTLKTFQAEMLYQNEQFLVETMTVRHGYLLYQARENDVRFRVHFADLQQIELDSDETAPVTTFDEDFSFDGLWAVRRDARTKMVQRWEISKTPANRETFRLGEGPFPLPFAVRKADVVREFRAEIQEDPCAPAGTTRLHLIPREHSVYAEQYHSMDLWISDKTALPEQIRFEDINEEITTVRWSGIQMDKDIDAKTFELAPPGGDWTVEEHPLKEEP